MSPSETLHSWVEISLGALAHNLRQLRRLAAHPEALIGVVKADAYGHGLYAVAKKLHSEKVQTLAVATLTEAAVASSAAPKAKIMLLSPLLPSEYREIAGNPRWIPILSNLEEARLLEKAAKSARRRVDVQIKLDTGMGRLGGFEPEALGLLAYAQTTPLLRVVGILSHLASAEDGARESRLQVGRFEHFCQEAARRGLAVSPTHFQNSAGTLRFPHHKLGSRVRPGLSLYGMTHAPQAWKPNLKPVLSWKARILLVRNFPRGATISYGGTFRAPRAMRVGVIGAGYADGISRKLSNRGSVLIQGQRCRILGRVTMDCIMVDLTCAPRARWGDEAVLIGRDGSDSISANEMAVWAETISYEITCGISRRVPRIVGR